MPGVLSSQWWKNPFLQILSSPRAVIRRHMVYERCKVAEACLSLKAEQKRGAVMWIFTLCLHWVCICMIYHFGTCKQKVQHATFMMKMKLILFQPIHSHDKFHISEQTKSQTRHIILSNHLHQLLLHYSKNLWWWNRTWPSHQMVRPWGFHEAKDQVESRHQNQVRYGGFIPQPQTLAFIPQTLL